MTRLLDRFRRDSLDRELAEELRFHRDRLERDARNGGDDAVDALHTARRHLGSDLRAREQARERWSFPWLDFLQQDLRYAARGLRKSPGFTATVMLTLGLGIGANAAMFGAIDQLMFRPSPYMRDASSVNRVYLQTTYRAKTYTTSTIPYTRYLDFARFSHVFSAQAAFAQVPLAIGIGTAAREHEVAGVSSSFFGFVDARPEMGRFLTATEDSTPVGASVVVLSHALWNSEFGGRNVLGQTVQIGTMMFTIVGVAPAGFVGVADGPPPVAFVPITTLPVAEGATWSSGNYFTGYNWDWTSMIVRRRHGVSHAAANADLTLAFRQSRDMQRAMNPLMNPDSLARPTAIAGAVKTAAGPDAGLEPRTLLWVTGVALIVLLIACANVANLMLARVLRRQREFAVRLALGVSRRRLIAQSLTEGLLLAALGCVMGLLVAQWGGAALRRIVLPDGAALNVMTDWRTLGVASAVALLAGVATALGPAIVSTRANLAGALRGGARGGAYQRSVMRSALLVLQGALSVVLLVGAGLFVRSLNHVRSMDLGYDAGPVLIVVPNYRGVELDSSAGAVFRRRLLDAAQHIPGVLYAARVNSRPFGTNTWYLRAPGIDTVSRLGRFNFQRSTPDYFNVMGTRIIRGRAFTDADRVGTPLVTVVSESMGRALWPGKDPIGQCIYIGRNPVPSGEAENAPCTTVIGIAEDAVQQSMTDDQKFMYYSSYEQFEPGGGNQLFLRVAGSQPTTMMETVRRDLQKIMPGQGYVTVTPLEGIIDTQRQSWRVGATMFMAFGALALAVAAVGLYGVISYNVAQRMHELGVRIALGAQSRDVVRLVVGQAISFAVAGVTLGLALALAAARWVQPLLFRESAHDPIIYGAVGAALLLVAITASARPALRATRADPNVALRSD
ncbi:MAG TPA: ADOP family duplicated permease [Gemmatimonadaceae bacterium]